MIKCLMCEKEWEEWNRSKVVAHYFDDHNTNLQFISDGQVRLMVKE